MSTVRLDTSQSKALDAQNGDNVNISPGIIGMYWLLASFGATAAWIGACKIARRAAHHATARCCGMCER